MCYLMSKYKETQKAVYIYIYLYKLHTLFYLQFILMYYLKGYNLSSKGSMKYKM